MLCHLEMELHQFRIIYRLALLVGFQVNLSKCILFIKLPFAVLDRAQLFFVLGLLDRLQIQIEIEYVTQDFLGISEPGKEA